VEPHDGLGRDSHLLAPRRALQDSASSGTGTCANGCALAASKDASKNRADSRSAADLLGCIGSATFTLDRIWIGRDVDQRSVAAEGRELDGEQRAAFEVGRVFGFDDRSADRRTGRNDDQALSRGWVRRTGRSRPTGMVTS
jgi:hypothetical protein